MLISVLRNHDSSCIHCMPPTLLWCVCVCVTERVRACERFFMCLARLASSSPCQQQSVVFLLAGLTLRHVKREPQGRRGRSIPDSPELGHSTESVLGVKQLILPLAPLKLRNPPPTPFPKPTHHWSLPACYCCQSFPSKSFFQKDTFLL